MSVHEIETAISQLPPDELAELLTWIEEYRADAWDREIAEDAKAGRFEVLRERVRKQRQAGECKPQQTCR
jgi:hypothetical protein